MKPIESEPILTAAAMRAAEQRAIGAGSSVQELMERAGAGVAEAVHRLAAGAPALILCGPGNNGGDGYVAARILRERGARVRVSALSEPNTPAAIEASKRWNGPVERFPAAQPEDGAYSPVLVDAVFGTGLSRPLDGDVARAINALVQYARLSVAVDLPSGVDTDTGAELNPFMLPDYRLTLALGALKPAHVLQPAASLCGTVRLIDIGLGLDDIAVPRENVSPDCTTGRPWFTGPSYFSHKYSRGMVIVLGGEMPGAASLSATAALHAGAGYALLFGEGEGPHALVRRDWSPDAFRKAVAGKSVGNTAVVVGPGLGNAADAAEKLECAIESGFPLVVDGDALRMLDDAAFERFKARPDYYPVVLTPHAGEFEALFGKWSGSKIEAARAAAQRSGAIVVFKGSDTVIAHPDGYTNVASQASAWLSTAGTGDVLAGIIAAMLAQSAFHLVEAGVWLHGEAARRSGVAFIADDLVRSIPAAYASALGRR